MHKNLSLAPLTARERLLVGYRILYEKTIHIISVWGLEPQTLSLEGSRAIQLRYTDIYFIYDYPEFVHMDIQFIL